MQRQVPWLAAERYEVGEVVGRGGYGMVCRGVDRETGRSVALKMLSSEAGRDPDVVERMLREQQAMVALHGTCAATVIDLCRLDTGAPCLVMEWLDGHDLEAQLTTWEAQQERGGTHQLLAILKPLTETLERAHQLGLVHRDIKPANVFLVTAAPGVRLLDFGLSRMKSAAALTAPGMVLGSPSYIAPETWRGNSTELDGRADLYALAVIVFRWLTGQLPFDAPDLIVKMTAVTTGPRPSVLGRRPELPAAVDVWMNRALAIEPSERFQTGSVFYASFEAALRGELWPHDNPEASGVRAVRSTAPSQPPERRGALAAAWGVAGSLLKRLTSSRKREGVEGDDPSAPIVAPLVSKPSELPASSDAQLDGPPSERKSIWLDSLELEDVPPSVVPPTVAPTTSTPDAPKRKGKGKGKGKTKGAKKAEAQPARSQKKQAKRRKGRKRKG